MRIIFPIWQKLKKICKKLPIFRNIFPINTITITQKELLDYCLKQAQQLAESQYLEIDSDYNLLDNHNWCISNTNTINNNTEYITLSHQEEAPIKPNFDFIELKRDIILLKIKYKRMAGDISFEIIVPITAYKNIVS